MATDKSREIAASARTKDRGSVQNKCRHIFQFFPSARSLARPFASNQISIQLLVASPSRVDRRMSPVACCCTALKCASRRKSVVALLRLRGFSFFQTIFIITIILLQMLDFLPSCCATIQQQQQQPCPCFHHPLLEFRSIERVSSVPSLLTIDRAVGDKCRSFSYALISNARPRP